MRAIESAEFKSEKGKGPSLGKRVGVDGDALEADLLQGFVFVVHGHRLHFIQNVQPVDHSMRSRQQGKQREHFKAKFNSGLKESYFPNMVYFLSK